LLTGSESDAGHRARRRAAEAWQHCSEITFQGCAQFPGATSGPPIQASRLRNWPPIPQTACEVCAIARQLRVPAEEIDGKILLAGNLRESEI
ncbi:hypothetical protein NL526_27820, partial [Klebsiella pneumoniae]|nr:hypothetical protein [Klebsiella pneumoniae]